MLPNRVLDVSKAVLTCDTFNGSTFEACQTRQCRLLETRKHCHAQVCMLCFSAVFHFPIENETVSFNCFPFHNHHTDLAMSARFCFGSQLTAAKFQVSRLSTPPFMMVFTVMVPRDTKWQTRRCHEGRSKCKVTKPC